MPPENREGESSGRSLTRSGYFVQMVHRCINCCISLGTIPCTYKARVVHPSSPSCLTGVAVTHWIQVLHVTWSCGMELNRKLRSFIWLPDLVSVWVAKYQAGLFVLPSESCSKKMGMIKSAVWMWAVENMKVRGLTAHSRTNRNNGGVPAPVRTAPVSWVDGFKQQRVTEHKEPPQLPARAVQGDKRTQARLSHLDVFFSEQILAHPLKRTLTTFFLPHNEVLYHLQK